MVASLEPAQLLPLLLPYADSHKNPKVRGKAGPAVADAVARMAPASVAAFGLPRLLQAAGKLVTGEPRGRGGLARHRRWTGGVGQQDPRAVGSNQRTEAAWLIRWPDPALHGAPRLVALLILRCALFPTYPAS